MEPVYNKAELLHLYEIQAYCRAFFHLNKTAYKSNEILKFNISCRSDVLKLKSTEDTTFYLINDEIKQLHEYLFILYCGLDELPLHMAGVFNLVSKWRFEIAK